MENHMKNYNVLENQTTRRILRSVCLAALVMAFTLSRPLPAYAHNVTPPPVPENIQVPTGHKAFLLGHAVGTQNYVCLPSDTGVRFVLFTPQATLFDGRRQLTTHYFSPNPAEGGTIRATWQHSRDTSAVWGRVMDGNSSSDPTFVAPGAIGWLLVTVVGAQDGSSGRGALAETTFIQRLNTVGGVAPATGCATSADIGHQAFVPYEADYFFYKAAKGN
jgi:hypothetical protein